ncbi:trypco2 family protein [Kitasatospora sp. NPDC050543]|uniref:trypco2 family protein n=1 Tax=Kitasatospora sp. NPDC050543 TaxID=3364054 RepID=UPI0037B3BD3F
MDLADAVALLRMQVAQAQRQVAESPASDVRFAVGEITLELGMELTGTRSVNGGLRFSVVSAGGKAERASKATHKVTVKLTPQDSAGELVLVNDEE